MDNRAQFLKGVARTLVLGLLRERPMYGYEIATALTARSEGVFALGQGTLYPLLYSLENKGLIRVGIGVPDGAATATSLLRFSKTKPETFVMVKLRTKVAAKGLLARSVRFVRAVKRYLPGCNGPSVT